MSEKMFDSNIFDLMSQDIISVLSDVEIKYINSLNSFKSDIETKRQHLEQEISNFDSYNRVYETNVYNNMATINQLKSTNNKLYEAISEYEQRYMKVQYDIQTLKNINDKTGRINTLSKDANDIFLSVQNYKNNIKSNLAEITRLEETIVLEKNTIERMIEKINSYKREIQSCNIQANHIETYKGKISDIIRSYVGTLDSVVYPIRTEVETNFARDNELFNQQYVQTNENVQNVHANQNLEHTQRTAFNTKENNEVNSGVTTETIKINTGNNITSVNNDTTVENRENNDDIYSNVELDNELLSGVVFDETTINKVNTDVSMEFENANNEFTKVNYVESDTKPNNQEFISNMNQSISNVVNTLNKSGVTINSRENSVNNLQIDNQNNMMGNTPNRVNTYNQKIYQANGVSLNNNYKQMQQRVLNNESIANPLGDMNNIATEEKSSFFGKLKSKLLNKVSA